MLIQLNVIFDQLQLLLKQNPVLATFVGIWGVTLIYLLKNIPLICLKYIKRQLTIELRVNSQDRIYYSVLEWIAGTGTTPFTRTFNINNSRYGHSDISSLTLGYGVHCVFWKKRVIFFTREEQPTTTEYTKETINFIFLGRNKKIIKEILTDIETYCNNKTSSKDLRTYKFCDNNWIYLSTIAKRPLDSIVMPTSQKKEIVDHIERFINNREWYVLNGVPYHTGILLEGPPGTGKTSLIKGLSSHFNRNLYLLNLKELTDNNIIRAFASLPPNALVVIEDIDACGVSIKRKLDGEDRSGGILDLNTLSISGLLNAFDGLVTPEGRLMIATTNHREELDEALLRQGRFDLHIHLGYLDESTLTDYLKRFYKDFAALIKPIRNDIRPCEVQQLIMQHGLDINSVLDKLYK